MPWWPITTKQQAVNGQSANESANHIIMLCLSAISVGQPTVATISAASGLTDLQKDGMLSGIGK